MIRRKILLRGISLIKKNVNELVEVAKMFEHVDVLESNQVTSNEWSATSSNGALPAKIMTSFQPEL
jgi:hypothetical protein